MTSAYGGPPGTTQRGAVIESLKSILTKQAPDLLAHQSCRASIPTTSRRNKRSIFIGRGGLMTSPSRLQTSLKG